MKKLIISDLDAQRLRERIMNIKEKTGKLNPELETLFTELERAKIIDSASIPNDVVTMHTKVKIKLSNNEKPMEFQIVYPEEADIKNKKISIFAPVATALLGYKKGDRIKWKVPSGEVLITIEDILFQPETGDETNL